VNHFVLSAIDPYFGCPTVETLIHSPDTNVLGKLVGSDPADDPELRHDYILNPDEARAAAARFGAAFDPIGPETRLFRLPSLAATPYLIHTGYELFLMLDGQKPFAIADICYPAAAGDNAEEVLFEPHVQSGRIMKRLAIEPFDPPVTGRGGRIYEGIRKLYYALPGEEWRIDAYLLLWDQMRYGSWNDSMERMSGALLGYTDVQNDWWLAHLRHNGIANWCMTTAYAVIGQSNLTWLRASGCRALPWASPGSEIKIEFRWPRPDATALQRWMEDTGAAAVIRLGLRREFLGTRQIDLEDGVRTYRIPPDDIPELNRSLERQIEIIVERDL